MWGASGGLCSGVSGPDTPSESGYVPAGDVVSPLGSVLSPVTTGTAPALGTETTALGPETSAWSPSPGHPWGTPASAQVWTPGPPPRRGGSGMVGLDRNSTAQGAEEDVPGLGTGQWVVSRAPRPTRSPLPGVTDGPVDTPGWLLRDSTAEPPAWPTPAEGLTGHVTWHTSLPTGDTQPAPLDPTQPQDTDPGPSGFPDVPSAPAPAACGECLELRIPGTAGSARILVAKAPVALESKTFGDTQAEADARGRPSGPAPGRPAARLRRSGTCCCSLSSSSPS